VTEDVKDDEATEIVEDDTKDETSTAADGDIVEDAVVEADDTEVEDAESADEPATPDTTRKGIAWSRVIAFVVLPALALVLAAGAGYLKWRDDSVRNGEIAAVTSVQAARDGTVALLSYRPETVEQQLGAARDLLTGEFRDSYTSLTNDVVIPGAKEKQISAIASVPAAASVSATPEEAVVLLFVNQTVTVGPDAPTDTASSVRVTLEKDGDRWLISKFDPV
jgi:Mce-associated membrane protein